MPLYKCFTYGHHHLIIYISNLIQHFSSKVTSQFFAIVELYMIKKNKLFFSLHVMENGIKSHTTSLLYQIFIMP